MTNLRNKTIKLAHENKALRPHLLRLLVGKAPTLTPEQEALGQDFMDRAEKVANQLGFRINKRAKHGFAAWSAPSNKEWLADDLFKAMLSKMKQAFPELKVDRSSTGVWPPHFPVEGTVRVKLQEGGTFSPSVSIQAPTYIEEPEIGSPEWAQYAQTGKNPHPHLVDGGVFIDAFVRGR